MAPRRRAAKKPPRSSPRRAPAGPTYLASLEREPVRLSETLTFVKLTAGPVTTILPDGSMRRKRRARSEFTEEARSEHFRRHPRNELNPKTGQPLGRVRQRMLKDDQNISVDRRTIGRLLKPSRS